MRSDVPKRKELRINGQKLVFFPWLIPYPSKPCRKKTETWLTSYVFTHFSLSQLHCVKFVHSSLGSKKWPARSPAIQFFSNGKKKIIFLKMRILSARGSPTQKKKQKHVIGMTFSQSQVLPGDKKTTPDCRCYRFVR